MGSGRRRTATVIAISACELFRLDAADFTRAIAHHPELLEHIARVAADRLERTEEADSLH
jgi:CRP-like cAMP-binding protein